MGLTIKLIHSRLNDVLKFDFYEIKHNTILFMSVKGEDAFVTIGRINRMFEIAMHTIIFNISFFFLVSNGHEPEIKTEPISTNNNLDVSIPLFLVIYFRVAHSPFEL